MIVSVGVVLFVLPAPAYHPFYRPSRESAHVRCQFPRVIPPSPPVSLSDSYVAFKHPLMVNPLSCQTSQDIRKRVKAGHAMNYAEHAHLERGANVSFPCDLS